MLAVDRAPLRRAWPTAGWTRLADELADQVPPRSLDATVATGRRDARRRRTLRLAATGLLVAATTAGAGATLRPGDSPSPTAEVCRTTLEIGPVVTFFDPRHGYAYIGRCRPLHPLDARLYATADGGTTWRRIPAPVSDLRLDGGVALRALDARTVLVENGDRRWVSRDGGRRWRTAGTRPGGPLAIVPTGTRPFLRCADDGSNAPCRGVRLVVEDPRDGLLHLVRSSPPLPLSAVSLTSDGELWSVGVDPNTAKAVVSRSSDRGATWSVNRVALQGLYGVSVRIAAADAQRAFIVVSANRSGWFASQFAALYATVDGGRTWRLAERRGLPYRSHVEAVALASGRLVVLDPRGAALVSDDAGGSFVRTARLPGYAGSDVARGMIVARTDNGTRFTTSVDGVRWTAIRLPRP